MATLTLEGSGWRRWLSLVAGLGMMAASCLTIHHYFAANFGSVSGSVCDISAFINCGSSSYSPLAQIAGAPLGYFGLMVGGLLVLGALFPSQALERTNGAIAALNAVGVVALAGYSLLVWKSLCLYCSIYWLFSLVSFGLFWAYGAGRGQPGGGAATRLIRPSIKVLATFGVVVLAGGFGMRRFHAAKLEVQVAKYFALPPVHPPSILSPYWSVKSTAKFEDAPIHMVEYGDLLCSDCLYLFHEMEQLKEEFKGKINVAFQFFPLETKCNGASRRTLHPFACDVSYIAAHDVARFAQIHDEIYTNFWLAKRSAEWRAGLAKRYGAEEALTDTAVQGVVRRIMDTGREYAPTSATDPRGIHATPTMILNGRMFIGTLPLEQLRAIFQALVDRRAAGGGYIENWVP
jgi:uncharacterized membrane protein/protein-disulfide isomerase